MDERDIPRSGTVQRFMPPRMQCRFITIDDVDFQSHRGTARQLLADAFGLQPITMRLPYRLDETGARVWNLQASLDVESGFDAQAAAATQAGVLGLDFNFRGIAWYVVKPDGNRLIAHGEPQSGFAPWQLKGTTSKERQQAMGIAVAELTARARCLRMGVAIENLDFATRRTMARLEQSTGPTTRCGGPYSVAGLPS